MIYVSQGHEKGIGLEVFIKSFLCLTKDYQDKFILISNTDTLNDHAKFLASIQDIGQSSIYFHDGCMLKVKCLDEKGVVPQTTMSLNYCLENMVETDILLTLPSSKDQFFLNEKKLSGHTEFFRKYYHKNYIGMNFLAQDTNVLLLTDHISISDVTKAITISSVINKVNSSLLALEPMREIEEIFFTGINPHCGENGEISHADDVIAKSILQLKKEHPSKTFFEMLAGDTIHFNMKSKKQLFVYAFHDQGLAPFKLKYGLSGINFTSGIPYRRVSVDHGTSFNMYGKNIANYSGMLFLLSEIEGWT